MRVIVAGAGNVLRGDDGFGVEVIHELSRRPLPAQVELLEVGIGGIHLVQEMLDPVHGLVVVDAVDMGRPPGTLVVVEPDVEDVAGLAAAELRDTLADTHYATPERAMMFARALGVLPDRAMLVGCQVADPERLGESLSEPVRRAVPAAADEVLRIVEPWLVSGAAERP